MQHQPYFVVVLAHSLHGKLRRIQIPHKAIYATLVMALVGCLTTFGFVCSYLRMTWKVSNYNSLRREVDSLRLKYKELQKVTNQKNEQLASLQMFASEVSVAYGLKSKPGDAEDIADVQLSPTFHESLVEYNFLKTATISNQWHTYARQWQVNVRPTLWPLNGRLLSPFGGRTDPFSGEGAMHTGVDLSASPGTPVHVTADGIVSHASWGGQYGNLVIVDHGSGMQTWYAHLSRIEVVPGQEIRRGDELGRSGATGKVTAPHLHYEIRVGGTPINPYPYLAKSLLVQAPPPPKDLPF
ncbi:MAG TPA: M23 family metallopeptidase [Bryobacteraceae bacterium]|nr:M23 family metallopeptidase [Bryobacteraceae bacterium]